MLTNTVGEHQPNLRRDVLTVKRALRKNGFPLAHPGSPVVDEETVAAIRAFQEQHNILPATGVVAPRDRTIRALWPVVYADPTGLGPRGEDSWGSGAFGASRVGRIHDGTDYVTRVGQKVRAPISGLVVGISAPYADGVDADVLSGVYIVAASGTECWVWYIAPVKENVGELVRAGETVIGTALSLQRRYEGITDHVHVRVHLSNGTATDPAKLIPFLVLPGPYLA